MDDSGLDPHFTQCFSLIKLMLCYMPLNPYRRFLGNFSRRDYFIGLCLYCFVLFSQLVLAVIYILFIVNQDDFLTTVAVSAWLVLAFVAFLNTWSMFVFGQDVADVISLLYEAFPKTREERQLIDAENWTRDWANKMIVLRTVVVSALLGMVISPFVQSIVEFVINGQWEYKLPLLIWLPFDPFVMPIYPLVYIVEAWFFIISSCTLAGGEVILGEVAILICLQFKKVALQFQSITFGEYKADLKALLKAMQLHKQTLDLAEKARKAFAIALFINFVSSSMVTCIFTFLIVNETDFLINCQYSMNLICFLVYMAMFGYMGDLVMESSTAVAEAVFATNWMDADVRIQKMIIMIIQRSNSPQTLTGLDFFDVNFPQLAKILTTSYSYFTLLKSSYKN